MSRSFKTLAQTVLKAVVALTPWLISMYLFYWLQYSGTWTIDTPHRGKVSVAILAAGMILSCLIQSHFYKRK